MLSISSFASWLSVYRIWRDIYLDLPPIFDWIAWFLILSSISCLYILEINSLLLHLQIFLPFLWASQVALVVKNPPASGGRHKRCRFDPWVRKIPRRKARQLTPVFLPGESHGQRWATVSGVTGSDVTEVTMCARIADWQCSGAFRSTVKGFSHMYTRIHSPPSPLASRLLQNITSSMCWTGGPCWLSVLNVAVCTCQSQTP